MPVSELMDLTEQLAKMEARLSGIEKRLDQLEAGRPAAGWFGSGLTREAGATEALPEGKSEEELEYVVGQTWFAHAGIVVLAIGAALALSLPYPGLPAVVPSLAGYALVAGLFGLARAWTQSFELLSHHLRAAGMALLFFATVRLFYFGAEQVLSVDSAGGRVLLVGVAVVNLAIALRRRSNYLMAVALPLACLTALLLGEAWLCLGGIAAVAVVGALCRLKFGMPGMLLLAQPLVYATYLTWALNNPLRGGDWGFVEEPVLGVYMVLVYGLILGAAPLLRRDRAEEGSSDAAGAVLNVAGCYAVFLVHTLATLDSAMVWAHLGASGLFLGLAVTFWVIQHSQAACFLYAMTGYTALSVAILHAFSVPDVFVWLSVQSLVVVATALWFRSPFIVSANFFIYLAIVLGYMAVVEQESGVSLGFGLVALVSARILRWQRERLQLKTDLMRNAYLLSAFGVFPYALYHLVPSSYVAVSWVGLACMYYLLNAVIRNVKYRWMGHGTLLLTVLYVLVVGMGALAPTHRILSFLLLGSALVAVSLVFTRQRARSRSKSTSPEGE